MLIIRSYLSLKVWRKTRVEDAGADLGTVRREGGDVFRLKAAKALLDARIEPVGGHEFAERLRGGGEAARHAYARRSQRVHHFAERGILAADSLQVRHAEIFEPGYAHCLSILSS